MSTHRFGVFGLLWEASRVGEAVEGVAEEGEEGEEEEDTAWTDLVSITHSSLDSLFSFSFLR